MVFKWDYGSKAAKTRDYSHQHLQRFVKVNKVKKVTIVDDLRLWMGG